MIYYATFPPGTLRLETYGEVLTRCEFVAERPGGCVSPPDGLIAEAVNQLDEYFRGERQTFDLPLAAASTHFQAAMRATLEAVRFGETITYGQLAALMGSPRAVRAVGQALGANPLHVIIPCHRVTSSHGIGGYAAGEALKRYLLEHESPIVRKGGITLRPWDK